MADPQNNAAGSTPDSSGQPQPTEFKVPEGKVLADRAEYERNNARLSGMQGYFEAGSKYGLKRPEDFESVGKWRKFEESLKARGMTTDQIMAAFEAPEQEQSSAAAPDMSKYLTQEQADKMLETKRAEWSEFDSLMGQHRKMMDAEPTILAKVLSEVLPDNADPRDKRALAAQVRAYMAERGVYPADHKLSKHEYAPWNEAGIKGLADKAKKELALEEGAAMAKAGDDAKRGSRASPAGATSDRPGTQTSTDNGRPKAALDPAKIEAIVAAGQAKRNRGSVSSLG